MIFIIQEECKKHVEEIYKKHGVKVTPVRTKEDMIKASYFQGRGNYDPDEKVSEIK